MKTMTCKQLGGACDKAFHAKTWDEIKELSKNHGMEMFQQGDKAHLEAMQKMKETMKNPEDFQKWMGEKKKLFDSLPEDQ